MFISICEHTNDSRRRKRRRGLIAVDFTTKSNTNS